MDIKTCALCGENDINKFYILKVSKCITCFHKTEKGEKNKPLIKYEDLKKLTIDELCDKYSRKKACIYKVLKKFNLKPFKGCELIDEVIEVCKADKELLKELRNRLNSLVEC